MVCRATARDLKQMSRARGEQVSRGVASVSRELRSRMCSVANSVVG